MFDRRIIRLFLVVALVGLLSGCAATPPSPQKVLQEIAPSFEAFTLRLPRLYLQYVENERGEGEPMVAGIKASDLETWFGVDLSIVKIPKFYVDWIKASNLQHIEVVNDPKGLFAYVNGKPLPYLAWDADSLALLADLAEAFKVPNAALLKRVLPFLQHIGLDVVVQMPLAEGATFAPYRDQAAGLMETTAAPEIAEPVAQLQLEITYDERGVPSVLGISGDLLSQMGYGVPGQLPPQTLELLKGGGIQSIALQTRGDGLFLFINDQPLPNIAWSKEHLANALDLYARMNATSWVPNKAFVDLVRQVVTGLGNSEILLVVRFPG